MTSRLLAAAVLGLAVAPTPFVQTSRAQTPPAQTQAPPPGTPGHAVATEATPMTMSPSGAGAADQSFTHGMDKMHQSMMAVQDTGNTDRDFVLNMMPHHQGAIDMAQTELRYGKNPQMRRLAHSIVSAQEKEIGEMKAWLTDHPAK